MILRPRPEARFAPGDLVRHVRYGYRGVVVAWDDGCRASEAWYQANATQPARDQPWYHVLVHGSDAVTYAAQTSLRRDPEPEPVLHPLVARFFSAYSAGRYVRNTTPWPGSTEAG